MDGKYRLRYDDLLDAARKLTMQRGDEYNTEEISVSDYFPRGYKDVLVLCHIKLLRARASKTAESLKDSLLDLVNYAIFAIIEREKASDRPTEGYNFSEGSDKSDRSAVEDRSTVPTPEQPKE